MEQRGFLWNVGEGDAVGDWQVHYQLMVGSRGMVEESVITTHALREHNIKSMHTAPHLGKDHYL